MWTDLEPSDFLRLKTGEAIVKIGRTVMPLETVLLPQTPDHRRAQHIINRSRANYSGQGDSWYVDIKPLNNQKLLPPKRDKRADDDRDPTRVF
jgi:hypothetical protein